MNEDEALKENEKLKLEVARLRSDEYRAIMVKVDLECQVRSYKAIAEHLASALDKVCGK